MDSGYKNISCFDEADAKGFLEGFFSSSVPHTVFKESTEKMVQSIYKAFNTGLITGRTVIDLSISAIIVPLLPMKDFVQEITVLVINDASQKELEKWMNKEPDAFDWSYTTELYRKIKEKSNESEDEEEKLRGKIKKILKWDLSEDNPVDALSLPKADIVTSIWCLETISKDHEGLRENLRKLSSLIKIGGHLVVFANVNNTYFKVGEHKFHALPCDEGFYRKAISEAGFEIRQCDEFDRKMITGAIDHDGAVCIVARKLKEP